MIALIAAISKNGIIGKENALPWYLPEDLKHFKMLTTGKIVLMGRKTFESILKRLGKPLPNRTNVIITRQGLALNDPRLSLGDVKIYSSIDEALTHHAGEEIMVAGGGEIFRQTIARADKLYITEVDQTVKGDVYFPRIDPRIWKETERETHTGFSFVTYIRNS